MTTIRKTQPKTKLKHGIVNGYRSGLEDTNARLLKEKGIQYEYETLKIGYIKPASKHTYTPDFLLPNGVIVETKGRFITEDRKKHLLIKEQHPELDIRFVFSNPNQKLDKRSKTTYAIWAEKHGFEWAAKTIPMEWIHEPRRDI